MNRMLALGLAAMALSAAAASAQGQAAAPQSATGSANSQQETWTGLPFSSLADYERKLPIGMTRDDLVRLLGQPEQIMPGHEQDQVYLYGYRLADGRDLTAVVVLRENAVFIRRLYATAHAAPADAVAH